MRLHTETPAERDVARRAAGEAVTAAVPRWVVIAGATLVAGWLALDALRQTQLGVDDAGLWFVVFAGWIAAGAAVSVSRWPERRRMALLILWWLAWAVADD